MQKALETIETRRALVMSVLYIKSFSLTMLHMHFGLLHNVWKLKG